MARLFALTASLGADLAVIVLAGVALAFIAAAVASLHARFQNRAVDLGIVAGVAGLDPVCHVTNVGAVQIVANALSEL